MHPYKVTLQSYARHSALQHHIVQISWLSCAECGQVPEILNLVAGFEPTDSPHGATIKNNHNYQCRSQAQSTTSTPIDVLKHITLHTHLQA